MGYIFLVTTIRFMKPYSTPMAVLCLAVYTGYTVETCREKSLSRRGVRRTGPVCLGGVAGYYHSYRNSSSGRVCKSNYYYGIIGGGETPYLPAGCETGVNGFVIYNSPLTTMEEYDGITYQVMKIE